MEITIRKSVPPTLKKNINRCINIAKQFVQQKYPEVSFDNVDYIFSSTSSRSRYFRNEDNDNPKYDKPVVQICTRGHLYLYEKRSLKLDKYEAYVGTTAQTLCALIHELTHHAQYEQNHRKGNELDTTTNEVEFLRKYMRRHYKKLKTITTQ